VKGSVVRRSVRSSHRRAVVAGSGAVVGAMTGVVVNLVTPHFPVALTTLFVCLVAAASGLAYWEHRQSTRPAHGRPDVVARSAVSATVKQKIGTAHVGAHVVGAEIEGGSPHHVAVTQEAMNVRGLITGAVIRGRGDPDAT
jgi:hypothetical protein